MMMNPTYQLTPDNGYDEDTSKDAAKDAAEDAAKDVEDTDKGENEIS